MSSTEKKTKVLNNKDSKKQGQKNKQKNGKGAIL